MISRRSLLKLLGLAPAAAAAAPAFAAQAVANSRLSRLVGSTSFVELQPANFDVVGEAVWQGAPMGNMSAFVSSRINPGVFDWDALLGAAEECERLSHQIKGVTSAMKAESLDHDDEMQGG